MDAQSLIAAGWRQTDVAGFTGHAGPFWLRDAGKTSEAGLIIEPRHCNHIETVHGGVLMTLADTGLGFAVVNALGAPTCATLQLNTQFVAAARVGEFIVCRAEVLRRTAQVVFVRGLICVGERVVANVDGVWKVLTPRSAS